MRIRLLAFTELLLLAILASVAAAGTLDQVRERGTLRWGGDASGGGPYIYEGPDGKLVGFEYELLDYLAHELGVRPEFVQWEWETLPQKLKQGSIDVVLNGYEWSAERERETPSTIPYYIYKLQLLTRSDDASIKSWDDLRAKSGEKRKRVGVLQGSAAARYVEKEFGESVELLKFPEITMVMGMVEQGTLDATLQDVPIVTFYGPQYPKLHSVGEPVEPGYYVGYVRGGDDSLRERLNAAILKAIDDGTLRRIYEKYGVWNDDQLRLADIAKKWPPSAEAEESRWARLPYYTGLLLRAAWTTVELAFLSMPLAILIGLCVAMGRLYGPSWLRLPLEAYVEFLRGTPLLMQLFVLYYLLPQYTGISLPEFWTGVLGLAINYSAYEAENYRAGLLAIPRGQMEAAQSLGMSTSTALRRVIVPQAVRIVIPPVTNDFIALFKDTSVVSMISVIELTGEYRFLINNHPRLMLEFGLMTAALYLAMSYPLSLVARRMETRFKKTNM
jgi:polar amino acid transport system permease protein/polar amino acid transport system substrate-binding protein